MPLFKLGNFDEIGLTISSIKHKNGLSVKYPEALNSLSIKELSSNLQIPTVDMKRYNENWSLYLKSIMLFESFEGLLNCIKPNNEIYFTSIAWDYSGKEPFFYPPTGIDPSSHVIKMKKKKEKSVFGKRYSVVAFATCCRCFECYCYCL